MNTYIQAITILLPVMYLAAAALFGMAFAGDRSPAFAVTWRKWALGLTVLLHGTLFALRAQINETFPIVGASLFISALALTTALLFLTITMNQTQPAAGSIVLVAVGLMQLGASCFGPVDAELLEPADTGDTLHVITTLLASAAMTLSGMFGYLHILLFRQFRQKKFGTLFRQLPDLEQLARITRKAALAGFIFMTLGLNVGIAVAHKEMIPGFGYLNSLVITTMTMWIFFGLIAFSRFIPGFTARRTSFAAAFGLAGLIVTIILTFIPGANFHS